MSEYKSLKEYARHIRQESHDIMASLCRSLGPEHPTTLKALALVTEAAEIVKEQREGTGEQEVVAAGDYDLAALGYDPYVPDDEGPFAGE